MHVTLQGYAKRKSPVVANGKKLSEQYSLEAHKPTQDPEIQKTLRLREHFRKVRANFCLLPCYTSQEPKGNCVQKYLFRWTFLFWVDFFRVDFPPLIHRSLRNGVPHKRRLQSRPYRRCRVDTAFPYGLFLWKQSALAGQFWCWVAVLRAAWSSGVDTAFRIGSTSSIWDWLPPPVCRHRFCFSDFRKLDHFLIGGSQKGGFQKGGFGRCSPVPIFLISEKSSCP